MPKVTISKGFSEAERAQAAALYWQAFGPKLGKVMGPPDRGVQFFTRALDPDYALCARNTDGRLLGLAGFKTHEGSFADGGLGDLIAVYGVFGSLWRAALLAPLSRGVEEGCLLMDGICVSDEARGLGIGTRLLDTIKAEAAKRGLSRVRLDVINTNPRAHALYVRQGFRETAREETGPLRHLFNFSHSTTMMYELP